MCAKRKHSVRRTIIDFETEMHFTFADKKVFDSSEINWDNKISDKTKRDSYFYREFEDNSQFQFEGMRWK